MKKVLKVCGKTTGIILAAVIGILAVLSVITLCWSGVQRSRGSVMDFPAVPDDFKPDIRFIVFTDTHNENENVALAIDTAYELFDNDPVYPGVDAFVCTGDISSIGTEPDYTNYQTAVKEHLRPETPIIEVQGNHEFKNIDHYKELFSGTFDQDLNTVTEINGFSFIGFSGERGLTEWTFTRRSLIWFADALEEADAKADGRPVFVFQHPHPWGTVYGSTVWGDPQINVVLNGHGSVVDFSGHSHFPMSDPRSINQTTYTAIGCGAMARFELDNNYIVGQHPDGYEDAAEMAVVEATASGSVRVRGFDLLSGTYFCDWFIPDVNDRDTYAYTFKNVKAHDKAPEFAENMTARAFKNDEGEWVISFTEATAPEGYIVHEYKVTIKDESGKKIFGENFVDDYFVFDEDNTADFRIGHDTLESGKRYTLEVRAESAYHLYSDTITLEFTAE